MRLILPSDIVSLSSSYHDRPLFVEWRGVDPWAWHFLIHGNIRHYLFSMLGLMTLTVFLMLIRSYWLFTTSNFILPNSTWWSRIIVVRGLHVRCPSFKKSTFIQVHPGLTTAMEGRFQACHRLTNFSVSLVPEGKSAVWLVARGPPLCLTSKHHC